MKRRSLLMSTPAIPLTMGQAEASPHGWVEILGAEGSTVHAFGSRAEFSEISRRRNAVPRGTVVLADGLAYRAEPGATMLPGLPNWLPVPAQNGHVSIRHFGAIPDGDRLTGTGTDNTQAIRAAFATPHHLDLGLGTYRVTGPILNLYENRQVCGAGMGVLASSPDTISHFSPPTSLLATGVAVRRVITRRKYRADASAPNDAPISAVIENWGGGSIFSGFSIELFCDYNDENPTNYGAEWDVGFFNGCRGSVSCRDMSINGYFRKVGFYWDVTDAYSIPNHLDLDGNPIPLNGPDEFGYPDERNGGATVRSSGADHCSMYRCEVKGARVGRAILGAGSDRTGEPYYDYVTGDKYWDFRGGSGASDFRSRDCIIFGPNHHSGYRLADPNNWGSHLTEKGMDAEDDFAPAAQYVDVWASNTGHYGPENSARGLVFDDNRYVSWEMFITRWGQCHEVYIGPRVWTETGDGLYTVRDTSGNVITNTYDDVRSAYLPLATNNRTGWMKWENISTKNIEQRWVHDWRYVTVTDRRGRIRGPRNIIEELPFKGTYIYYPPNNAGSFQLITRSEDGVPFSGTSAILLHDTGSTPTLTFLSNYSNASGIQLIGAADNMTAEADKNKLVIQAEEGRVVFYNNLNGGDVVIAIQNFTG